LPKSAPATPQQQQQQKKRKIEELNFSARTSKATLLSLLDESLSKKELAALLQQGGASKQE